MERNRIEDMEKSMKLREQWYSNRSIQYLLIESLKYRESVFLKVGGGSGLRCLKLNAMGYLMPNFKEWGFFHNQFNLYSSLGIFPDMEMASWNRNKYKIQKTEFMKNHIKLMKGFDFMFDLDKKKDEQDLSECFKSAVKLKQFLDDKKIIYYIIWSGVKGFHFRIDYEDMGQYLKSLPMAELIKKLKVFSERINLIENIPHIDLKIVDSRRFTKVPYSVVIPDVEGSDNTDFRIAMPLSDSQFEDFKMENYLLSKQIYNIEALRNRGLLKREGVIEGFSDLVKQYTEDE